MKRRQIGAPPPRSLIAALGLATVVATTTGCGDSDCAVTMTVSDSVNEAVDYDSTGENLCSKSELSGLVILESYRDLGTGATTGTITGLQVNVQNPTLDNGTFPATVVVNSLSHPTGFQSDACTITVSNVEVEDWTVTDYVNYDATVVCSEALGSPGSSASIDLGPTTFRGHVLDE
ncbi:hypothetical protein PPSIR1_08037 [Plesiocystis pacifica SIR-1]|uniref:Lipoprotein n=1 Tax=Plesiocystis pacifica SIR-1 TaxID=391625 RepID=A6GG37_9BACT|nr:hypothetical protein [Plesiocystis pacifica]EDM75165.1 hypothetical protein PPSIR1_08037 [Plesiocystis pacifica SIR-1]